MSAAEAPEMAASMRALSEFFCVALIALGRQGFRTDTPTRPTEPPRLSIVVLPFANASGTPKDEELAAALTDDFTTDLAQIRGSVVIARSMAQAIAVRKLPLPAVGSELAVRYVLEGNIRRSPEGIEFNVELSDAASGTSLWTRQFKEAAGEPADLRLQVTESLLFALRTAFMDAEARRVSSLPDATLTADDLLLKVSALNNQLALPPARNAENIAMLERALALDPTSAEVMISLADQILRPISEFADRNDIDERLLRAQTLADSAPALAADSESMLELRARLLYFEGHFDEALAAYSALYRSSGHFRISVAWCLIALGRSAEAVPLLDEAIRLDRGMRTWYMGISRLAWRSFVSGDTKKQSVGCEPRMRHPPVSLRKSLGILRSPTRMSEKLRTHGANSWSSESGRVVWPLFNGCVTP
jgi:TolB-like protein